MIYQVNCSEASYRVSINDISNLSEEQRAIFDDIIRDSNMPIFDKEGSLDWKPYFEQVFLDLFLDYFKVPSSRTHWTASGTTYISKEKYTKLMKGFCKKYGLKFKDIYEKRYVDNGC